MKKRFRKAAAMLLAFCMISTSIPMTAFAASEPIYLPEREIDDEALSDGDFYLGTDTCTLTEGTEGPYLLKVARKGDGTETAKVRLQMMDITAKYGENYKIKLYDKKLTEPDVQNAGEAQSVLGTVEEAKEAGELTEYNYSDAIIDGYVTAEDQEAEEEALNTENAASEETLPGEETEDVEEIKEETGEETEDVEEIKEETGEEAEEAEEIKEETGEEAEEAEEIKEETEEEIEEAGLEILEAGGGEVTLQKESNLSIAQAKELFTGVENDKTAMETGDLDDYLETAIEDLEKQTADPYLGLGLEGLMESLSSAYIDICFEEGVTERYIGIIPLNNDLGQGTLQANFSLLSLEGSTVADGYSGFVLMLEDDEEVVPDTIEFSAENYTPENGYITVIVTRTGNCTENAYVELCSESITAEPGINYSEVDTSVDFPYGITERSIKIPVCTAGLTEDAEFRLRLYDAVGGELGDRTDAVCTIRLTDESFSVLQSAGETTEETVEPEKTGESISDESGLVILEEDLSLLTASRLDKTSVVKGQAIDLTKPTSTNSKGSSSYNRKIENDTKKKIVNGWVLHPGHKYLGYAETTVVYCAYKTRYDINGYQIVWEKNSKKPHNGSTFFGPLEKGWRDGQPCYFVYQQEIGNERWDMKEETRYIRMVENAGFEIEEQSWAHYPSTLYIRSVNENKRIFEVSLKQADAYTLIDSDGTRKDNTSIEAYKTANRTALVNAVDDKLYTVSDQSFSVKLTDSIQSSYIAGLQMYDANNPDAKPVTIKTYPVGTTEAAFELSSDFINSKYKKIKFETVNSKDAEKGYYGQITIQPIVKPMPATVKVKEDTRATIKLWDGKDKVKTGTSSNGYTVYDYYVGDNVRYTVEIKEEYQSKFTWNDMQFQSTVPKERKIKLVRENGDDYLQNTVTATETEVTCIYNQLNNQVRVRILRSDVDKFDGTKGIFTGTRVTDGKYYYYTVDDESSHINGKRYELTAETRDKKYLPVWKESYKETKYAQRIFYYTGEGAPENNVITLSFVEKNKKTGYTLTGTAFYDNRTLTGSVSAEAWYPASGIQVIVDGIHYGIGDDDGKIQTGGDDQYDTTIEGASGYYLRYKIGFGEDVEFKSVKFGTGKNVDIGNYIVSSLRTDRPRINLLKAVNDDGAVLDGLLIAGEQQENNVTFACGVTEKDPNGKEYKYSYTENGKTYTVVEKPIRVEFVVYNSITHEEKGIFTADKTNGNGEWIVSRNLCNSDVADGLYRAGDHLYARLVTDRKVAVDGKLVFGETTYAPVDTGLYFEDMVPSAYEPADIEMPEGEYFSLPIIGKLATTFGIGGMMFRLEDTPNGGKRIYMGITSMPVNSHFNEKGQVTSDDGFVVTFDSWKQDLDDMAWAVNKLGKALGGANGMAPNGIGLPAWSFSVNAGAYFEFALFHEQKQDKLVFVGGGGFIGAKLDLRYTYYMAVAGIPCYIGGAFRAETVADFGFAYDENKKIAFTDILDIGEQIEAIKDSQKFDFIYRAKMTGSGYAGVGLYGTVGVRGGIDLILEFIANPTINYNKKYANVRQYGFGITGDIKFTIDALLVHIPIEAYSYTADPLGYFKDLKEFKNDPESGNQPEEALQNTAVSGDLSDKPRSNDEATEFSGDEPSVPAESTFGVESIRTVLQGNYEDAAVQLISISDAGDHTDGGDVKKYDKQILMVYLEDDRRETDLTERTKLMYSIYSEETDTWSEPARVTDTDCAEFSPNLCDCGDRVLISWISRKDKADISPEEGKTKNNYSEVLSTTEVYTAWFSKEDGTFSDIRCMTDTEAGAAQHMNVNPKAVYDEESGTVMLYYLKSEVPAEITGTQQMLNAVMPQTNLAEVAYQLYDVNAGKWVEEYYPGEVAVAEAAETLQAQYKGQRFIASQIEAFGQNNPIICDYDVAVMEHRTYTMESMYRDAAAKLSIPWDPDNWTKKQEAAIAGYIQANKLIYEGRDVSSIKTSGVYAYTVDEDQSVKTENDQELFIQLYDFETHKFTEPVMITDNEASESRITLVSDGEEEYLFWLEGPEEDTEGLENSELTKNTGRLCYICLGELLKEGLTLENAREMTGTVDAPAGEEGETYSYSSYRVFPDEDGTLYVSWQEYARVEEDEIDESRYHTDIYMTGYVKDSDGAGSWSVPLNISEEISAYLERKDGSSPEVNESMEFAGLSWGRLMMVGNAMNIKDSDGDSVDEISDVIMSQVILEPVGSMVPKEIRVNELPASAGEDIELAVIFRNEGVKQSKGFSYTMMLTLDGMAVGEAVSGDVEPKAGETIPAGGDFEVMEHIALPQEALGREEELVVRVITTEKDTSGAIVKELKLTEEQIRYSIENLQLEQDGEEYLLTGEVKNTSLCDSMPADTLIVRDQDSDILITVPVADLTEDGDEFEIILPATGENAGNGSYSVNCVIARDDEKCSDTVYATAYLKNPTGLLLNGSDEDVLNLKRGQTLRLVGSCDEALYYGNATAAFSVEDNQVASLSGNLIRGESIGETTLYMTMQPYGGNKEITVIVTENDEIDNWEISVKKGPSSARRLEGAWKQASDGNWYFEKTDGTKATGWGYTGYGDSTEYFYFYSDGRMATGWILDSDGTWYYMHEESDGRKGAMDRGWHHDGADGKWYYLDPEDGKMKTGWVKIGSKWYFLSNSVGSPAWEKTADGSWVYRKNGVRPYGSMYRNEITPDGYTVGEDGVWTGK